MKGIDTISRRLEEKYETETETERKLKTKN
jgi:hypothetical protein